ncbi:MAG: DUF3849 domain-containing protein, partial [Oscillospiraceae bacterium]
SNNSYETAQDSQDKVKEITDRLESGLKALFEGDNFRNYLNTMSKFHNYSFNNTMLIALQKPDATYVAGFNSWKKNFERSVNKGEKGIKIFAPAPYKMKKEQTKIDPDTELPVLDKDGKPVVEEVEVTIPAFKVVSVFDISQTNGKELPTLGVDELKGDVENFEKFFGVLKEVSPVPIKFDDIDGSAKGFYHHEDKAITVKTGMSDVQTIKTAIHEIAHAKLHDRDLVKADIENQKKDRKTEEVEAENIAYTVCQHFGIDTSEYSFAYVASWGSNKEMPELKASIETIRSTASKLITQIEDKLRGLEKEHTHSLSDPDNSTPQSQKNNQIVGNTAYKDIADKSYLKIATSQLPALEKLLEESNIPYSGIKMGMSTTITVSKKNYPLLCDYVKGLSFINELSRKDKEVSQNESKSEHSIIGNTPFKDIPEKSFAKLATDKALVIADILEKQGVKFSGRTDEDKTTLTFSKADMPKYKAALITANKALAANKSEDTFPKQNKLYTESFDYAAEHSEVKEFQTSHKENMNCLRDIKTTAEMYAMDGRLDVFLHDLTKKYGIERPLYVLSRTIQQVKDMRFSDKAKQIADKFEYPDKGSVHSFTHMYVTDLNPTVIDNMVQKLNEMKHQLEKASDITSHSVKSPNGKANVNKKPSICKYLKEASAKPQEEVKGKTKEQERGVVH